MSRKFGLGVVFVAQFFSSIACNSQSGSSLELQAGGSDVSNFKTHSIAVRADGGETPTCRVLSGSSSAASEVLNIENDRVDVLVGEANGKVSPANLELRDEAGLSYLVRLNSLADESVLCWMHERFLDAKGLESESGSGLADSRTYICSPWEEITVQETDTEGTRVSATLPDGQTYSLVKDEDVAGLKYANDEFALWIKGNVALVERSDGRTPWKDCVYLP